MLARDPRGIYMSRKQIFTDFTDLEMQNNIKWTCQHLAKNMHDYDLFDWLKSKIKFVRYEDVALNPIKLATEIYEFLGLDFPENIKKWLNENTNSSDNVGTYTTARNSRKGYFSVKIFSVSKLVRKVIFMCTGSLTC